MALDKLRDSKSGLTGWLLEANLSALADPKVKPKIMISCCKALRSKLENKDKRMFHVIDVAYTTILDLVRNTEYKPLGNDQDSYTMLEMFGEAYPTSWNLEEAESQKFAVEVLKRKLSDTLKDITNFEDIKDDISKKMPSVLDEGMK
ncbi:hypothetical protein AVEN_62139-1 [Araneus ventricosus]|uniref:Uncharacterized protein n=1 Tax=Araneus ventricosus TaxID=182803 RepID=A0A4Y2QED9_ARAVE|nr:hypothetical protein AVEN_62139-1 [Araneus ventricosus]